MKKITIQDFNILSNDYDKLKTDFKKYQKSSEQIYNEKIKKIDAFGKILKHLENQNKQLKSLLKELL